MVSVSLTNTGYRIDPIIVFVVFSLPRKTKLAITKMILAIRITNEGSSPNTCSVISDRPLTPDMM